MPNWVICDLYVSGNAESLKRFKEVAKGKVMDDGKVIDAVLDANAFIPYPKEWNETDEAFIKWIQLPDDQRTLPMPEPHFSNVGYDWCVRNWGTKWNFCSPELCAEQFNDETVSELRYGVSYLQYSFDTAWSPPTPLILKMGEMFPDLYFELTYEEGGEGFKGVYIVDGGTLYKDERSEMTSEDYGEEIEQ